MRRLEKSYITYLNIKCDDSYYFTTTLTLPIKLNNIEDLKNLLKSGVVISGFMYEIDSTYKGGFLFYNEVYNHFDVTDLSENVVVSIVEIQSLIAKEI